MSKNAVEKDRKMIKQLKEELHRAIQLYGIAYEKNIDIIQGLDIEIVKEQKERMEKVMDIKILTIHTTCSVI